MARRSVLRASDEDRERVVERLRHAAAEGRLLTDELEERLGAAFSARTYGELDTVLHDLPAPYERHKTPLWVKAAIAAAIVMAVLAVMAVVALIVIGVAGAWLLWMLCAWFFFGRRMRLVGHSRTGARAFRCTTQRARAPRGRSAYL